MSHNVGKKVDPERFRIQHAFWIAIFGLLIAAVLLIFLVAHRKPKIEKADDIVAIIGLFTSVIGTLVGTFIGVHIGSAGVEHERRSRWRAEEITRMALAHLHPDKAKELAATFEQQP
jgi:hypothetical protein